MRQTHKSHWARKTNYQTIKSQKKKQQQQAATHYGAMKKNRHLPLIGKCYFNEITLWRSLKHKKNDLLFTELEIEISIILPCLLFWSMWWLYASSVISLSYLSENSPLSFVILHPEARQRCKSSSTPVSLLFPHETVLFNFSTPHFFHPGHALLREIALYPPSRASPAVLEPPHSAALL